MVEPTGSERQMDMKARWILLAVMGLAMAVSIGFAQQGPGGNRERGERGDRQNQPRRQRMDPEQMRQQRLERVKEQLKPSDDEWQVLSPALEKVFTAQQNANTWGGFMMRDRQGQDNQQESDLQRATRELREAVRDNANDETIGTKLKAFRDARDKAQTQLTDARNELRELVTAKQEAVLVVSGILE